MSEPAAPIGDRIPIKRALVSVYDKTGLDDLVRGLAAAGVELVSTGGSAALIESLGLPVTKVEDLTGFPECLDGRVKTLHPRVHAGILADRRLPEHVAQLEELGVAPFDLVVVNLYPFTETVMSGASVQECIEKIDIGGPSMVRAAAKNHASVAILTDRRGLRCRPSRPQKAAASPWPSGRRSPRRRSSTPRPTTCTWLPGWATCSPTPPQGTGFPAWVGATWERSAVLRYGENPHQPAALYRNGFRAGGLATGRAAARQGDVLQQLRRHRCGTAGGVRLRPAGGRDHQARQPVRHRGRAPMWPTPTDAHTSATRCRRSVASSRSTVRSRSRWPSRWPRSSPR